MAATAACARWRTRARASIQEPTEGLGQLGLLSFRAVAL
jgi:hypothetical protein